MNVAVVAGGGCPLEQGWLFLFLGAPGPCTAQLEPR